VLDGDAVVARQVTLDGPRTLVRATPAGDRAAWAIEIVSAPAAQPDVDAAVAAVLSQRVWAPAPDRRARVLLTGSEPNLGSDPVSAVRTPWIAEAIARLGRDDDLQTAAARVDGALPAEPFQSAPWVTVATSSTGTALATAAESGGRVLVASAAPARNLFTPLLLRSLANALGTMPDLQRAEIVPIADRWLREWSRPPAPPAVPDASALRRDDSDNDRRWLWLAALALLAVESWMRRARTAPDERREEFERVA